VTDLRRKVALVTGGNGGIGLGMAEGLAKAGCDLVVWGSNPDKNAAAQKILEAHKVRVLAQRRDVADEKQVEDAFAGIAVHLMSDASAYHTGDSFVIDGAYTIF
jgi:NAD(P)-dependent dehydrogenase (short-subunit alcohol dehydrogenase family)